MPERRRSTPYEGLDAGVGTIQQTARELPAQRRWVSCEDVGRQDQGITNGSQPGIWLRLPVIGQERGYGEARQARKEPVRTRKEAFEVDIPAGLSKMVCQILPGIRRHRRQ